MSSFLSGPITVAAQTLHSSSSNQNANPGELIFSNDGRAFKYVLNGGQALIAGNLLQGSTEDTDTQDMTAVAAAVNDLSIASTTSVTVSANEYAGGFILMSVTPGLGRQYKISGHIAYSAAAPTFNLAEPVVVALTTVTRLDAYANPYSGVLQYPTSIANTVVGSAVHPIVADEFGWIQVLGPAVVLNDSGAAATVGLPAVASDNTAGSIEVIADGANELLPRVGVMLTGIGTSENGAVYLRLL